MVIERDIRDHIPGPRSGYSGCMDHHQAFEIFEPERNICVPVLKNSEVL